MRMWTSPSGGGVGEFLPALITALSLFCNSGIRVCSSVAEKVEGSPSWEALRSAPSKEQQFSTVENHPPAAAGPVTLCTHAMVSFRFKSFQVEGEPMHTFLMLV